ncbi:very short patch repair endonuclease [Cohnella rhizosphaerae]|uniref:very short patch repair endonuclease n=1 Tax=Cohnella rhizosphaerae TaxID=1457232 RepID=UPI003B8A8CD7
MPGKPDIVLPKFKTVIFVHGCFWHAHGGCKYYRAPKSNTDYWMQKIEKNITRDNEHQKLLKKMNWNIIVVWECELRSDATGRCSDLIEQIVKKVNQ